MSERKYKNSWDNVKINALKFALEEALKQSKNNPELLEEIKTLLKKFLDN